MALSARPLFFISVVILYVGAHGLNFALGQEMPTAKASVVVPTQALPPALKPAVATKPIWADLTSDQRTALSPLQAEWLKMIPSQKRKWLEVSKSYGKLSIDDQAKLHSRMTDWTHLSPEQRTHARFTFSAAKTLSPDEKQKKWGTYQALSDDEKIKLQAQAKANAPNSAALTVKPQNKVLPSKSTLAPATPAALANAEK